MGRMDRWRVRGDAALRALFPMVSFRDAFWVPMMAAAIPAAPFALAWFLAATALTPDLGSMSLVFQSLSVVVLSLCLIPAWYASFVGLYCLGFAVLVALATGLSACFWICDKRCSAGQGRGRDA